MLEGIRLLCREANEKCCVNEDFFDPLKDVKKTLDDALHKELNRHFERLKKDQTPEIAKTVKNAMGTYIKKLEKEDIPRVIKRLKEEDLKEVVDKLKVELNDYIGVKTEYFKGQADDYVKGKVKDIKQTVKTQVRGSVAVVAGILLSAYIIKNVIHALSDGRLSVDLEGLKVAYNRGKLDKKQYVKLMRIAIGDSFGRRLKESFIGRSVVHLRGFFGYIGHLFKVIFSKKK